MAGEEAKIREAGARARVLWPWALFSALLLASLVLYLIYPPR
jgi:hypothetical protein